jgi:hypothetical protein
MDGVSDQSQKTALRKRKRRAAQQAVDEWRGACVRHFAELEESLVHTLNALAENGFSQDISDPGFIAGRLQRLIEIAEQDSQKSGGNKLSRALRNLQPALSLRSALTHGSGPVRLDAAGRWKVTLRHFPPNGDRSELSIGQDEADKQYSLLATEVPKATQRMGAFVRRTKPNSQTPHQADTPSA